MIVPIPWVHALIGGMAALVSVPLVLRQVPMNRYYGIRMPKAFISEKNWYEVNAYGGKLFLAFGLTLLIFAWLEKDVAPPPTSPWASVWLAVPLALVLPVLLLINAYTRRLRGR
jgi:hypothetical protein